MTFAKGEHQFAAIEQKVEHSDARLAAARERVEQPEIATNAAALQDALKELDAAALVGDYTRFPDAITTELNRYNRAGVPLVLVYPKNADAPPIVLPEILTPGIVLDALDRAAR